MQGLWGWHVVGCPSQPPILQTINISRPSTGTGPHHLNFPHSNRSERCRPQTAFIYLPYLYSA